MLLQIKCILPLLAGGKSTVSSIQRKVENVPGGTGWLGDYEYRNGFLIKQIILKINRKFIRAARCGLGGSRKSVQKRGFIYDVRWLIADFRL